MHTSRSLAQRSPVLLFLVVLFASIAIKFLMVHSRELWLDEYYSAYLASQHFAGFLHSAIGDVHPPLYSLLLWLWVRLAGDSTPDLRALSVLLNAPAVVGIYLLGRRVLGAWFAVLAAILLALSPTLYTYSLEVRSYGLFVSVLVFVLLFHWLLSVEETRSRWCLFAYGVLSAMLVFTHYLGVVVLLGLVAHWLSISGWKRAQVTRIAFANVISLICVAPVLPLLLAQRARRARLDVALHAGYHNAVSLSFGTPDAVGSPWKATVVSMLTNLAAVMGVYPARSHVVLALLAIPIVVAVAGVAWLWLRKGDPLCRLAGTLSIAIVVGAFLLGGASVRYVLALAPLSALAFARVVEAGFASARLRWPAVAFGLALVGVYIAGFAHKINTPHPHPWHDLLSAVQDGFKPGDIVVFDVLYGQVPFDYQASHAHFQPRETGFPEPVYEWWNRQEFTGWGGPVITTADLKRTVAQLQSARPRTVWLVSFETGYYDPHRELLAQLSRVGHAQIIGLPSEQDSNGADERLELIRIDLK